MTGLQTIKRQVLPLLKGAPIIAIVFILALLIAQKTILYTPNTYQTIARIKLDDQKFGFSNTNLYEDFDLFTTENKIQAEAAVLKSTLLLGMALDSLDFSHSLYRKGRVKNTMLYQDSPINVETFFSNQSLMDKDYFIQVLSDSTYRLVNEEGDYSGYESHPFGTPTEITGGSINVTRNDSLIHMRELQLTGQYVLHVFSREGLIDDVSSRLDVVELDKDMPIIRVVYKDQHPQKVADLANTLCRTYIDDYVSIKSQAARQTEGFIDRKIEEVQLALNKAEIELEQYKAVHGVVNTRQETETGLRQISNLEVQLFNLEMNEKAIIELEAYIDSGDYFNETAINFGFGDLLMTELVKKLKLWQDERIDLLMKYTEDSERVRAVDQKIAELKGYIREAIARNKAEIITKRSEIEMTVADASRQFEGLSTREKELRILERNFHLQEQVYNFLSQKRIEASIAGSANLAFHRIIQEATVPREPVAPNGTLITFVSGLLGLLIGIGFILGRQYALARVANRQDLEKNSDLPIAGLVRSGNDSGDFHSIAKNLQIKGFLEPQSIVAISSTSRGEGKSYIAEHLASHLQKSGLRVALVKMTAGSDALAPAADSLESFLNNPVESDELIVLQQSRPTGLDWSDKMDALRVLVDVVIIDAQATAISMEGIEALKLATVSLYVIRANKTSLDHVTQADRVKDEYNLVNVMLLLNDAHKASNHSGAFVGTRFQQAGSGSGLKLRLTNYLNTYLR